MSYGGTHSANSQPFADWDAEETERTKGREVRERLSLVRIQPFVIFVKSYKCPYHVKLDLDLDLEHTLDAGLARNHRVQVWLRSSHLSGRRSDLRKMFTDRQTDGRRTPHDGISSLRLGMS